MNREANKEFLKQNGFAEADQMPVLSYIVPYCDFFYRVHEKQHQYVWVVTYDNTPVELVFEVFLVPRNSKAKQNPEAYEQEKRGLKPLFTNIARSLPALEAFFNSTYPDSSSKTKNKLS